MNECEVADFKLRPFLPAYVPGYYLAVVNFGKFVHGMQMIQFNINEICCCHFLFS